MLLLKKGFFLKKMKNNLTNTIRDYMTTIFKKNRPGFLKKSIENRRL